MIELNADLELNRRLEAAPLHPDLYHCGQGLVLSNDFMSTEYDGDEFFEQFPDFLHDRYTTPDLPARFDPTQHTPAAAVAKIAASGGRCIKMYYEEALWWPGARPDFKLPSEAIVREVVQEAHRRGMTVVLHATTPGGYRFALATGVDVLAHGLWEWPGVPFSAKAVPDDILALGDAVAASGIGVQPTVQVIRNEATAFAPGFLGDPALAKVLPASYLAYLRTEAQVQRQEFSEKIKRVIAKLDPQEDLARFEFARVQSVLEARYLKVLERMAQRKARFLFGTDTAVGALGWGNPPGLNGYWELRNWQRAGISLEGILKAATLDNAKAFGLEREVGSVSQGKRANLLLLTKNPLEEVEAYDAIHSVILNGTVIPRGSLQAQ